MRSLASALGSNVSKETPCLYPISYGSLQLNWREGSPVSSDMTSLGSGVWVLIVNAPRLLIGRTVRNRRGIDALLVVVIDRHFIDVYSVLRIFDGCSNKAGDVPGK